MPDVISRETPTTDPVTLEQVKQAYWARCVNGMDPVSREPYKRFVANTLNLNDYEDKRHAMSIWEPQSVDEEFNLVLSLCTDGKHRALVDVDEHECSWVPSRLPGSKLWNHSLVPSTSHWHGYGHYGSTFDLQLKVLGKNEGYLANVKRAGFAALRPPWVHKGWAEPVWYRSEFHGFEDTDWVPSVPQTDGKIGWEDLFDE